MHIQWGAVFQVHIKIIDEQHEETIRLFNALDDSIQPGGPSEEISGIVSELTKHLHFHIGTEEHYFDEFQYEHAERHKAAHRTFLAGMEQIISMYAQDPVKLATNLIPAMTNWLQEHTAIHDKKYVDCFREHGLV